MSSAYQLQTRNKRGDLLAVFSSPMTKEKWIALQAIPKHSKRFEILLPNGYRLKFGEHQNIMKQHPKRFSEYVRIATSRYFQVSDEDDRTGTSDQEVTQNSRI